MADFPSSEENQELLASYVLGDLTPEEVAEVHELLASHPELEKDLNQLQETLALLPLALPKTLPPAGLGSQILHSAAPQDLFPASKVNKQKLWLGCIAILSSLLAMGLGLYSYNLRQRLINSEAELSESKETIALLNKPLKQVFSLKSTKPSLAASGSLLMLPNSRIAVLSIEQLQPLPSGKIYRLWAIDKEEKIYCGEFNPDDGGKVFMQITLDKTMPTVSGVMITVESGEKMKPPMGEMVMTGNI